MRKQQGFTLLELMIVMFIIGVLIGPVMSIFMANIEQKRQDVGVGEFSDLYTSAQNFAAENVGLWPGEATNCTNAIDVLKAPAEGYLVGFRETSVFGTTYSITCPIVGAGQRRFTVSLDVNDEETALAMAGVLPSTTVVGSVITSSIPLPSEIPAFDLMLPRDGSRPMTGDLDMGGKLITNIEDMEMVSGNRGDEQARVGDGIFFAGIVNANVTNAAYTKPSCPAKKDGESNRIAIPIVVPAGNAPTVNNAETALLEYNQSGTAKAQANPIGAQYAWAESVGNTWKFHYKMAVYFDNNWVNDHRPRSEFNFVAVYFKCTYE